MHRYASTRRLARLASSSSSSSSSSTPPPQGFAVSGGFAVPHTAAATDKKAIGSLLGKPAAARFERHGGLRDERKHSLLPHVNWEPADEFPHSRALAGALAGGARSAARAWAHHPAIQRWARVSRSMIRSLVQPDRLAFLGASVASVYAVGAVEAQVVLSPEFAAAEPLGALGFVNRYALEQIVPSCVWGTQEASIVALALGIDPSAALSAPFVHPPPLATECSVDDAARLLQAKGLQSVRSIIATSMFLSQVLGSVSLGLKASDAFRDRVRLGKEPMFTGVEQRVIRLCGRLSDVTEVSLERYGPHILPVFERPSIVGPMVHAFSHGLRVPLFWQVSEGEYSLVSSWTAFSLSHEFFLTTTTGRRLLYLEADATNSERSLSLGAKSNDLTMEDASQAFLLIRRAARRWRLAHADAKPFRMFRVVLGDPRQRERTASRNRTLRERIDKLGQADVLVDSVSPVIGAVLRWCESMDHRREAAEEREAREAEERAEAAEGEAGGADGAGARAEARAAARAEAMIQVLYGERGLERAGSERAGSESEAEGAEEGAGRLPMSTIVFETDSPEYFANLSRALLPFGYSVMVPAEAEALETKVWKASLSESQAAAVEEASDLPFAQRATLLAQVAAPIERLPRLVYCTTTASTANAVQSLVRPRRGRRGLVEPERCCALLDRADSVDSLDDVHSDAPRHDDAERGAAERARGDGHAEHAPWGEDGAGVHIICTAVVYDDLLRQVRVWARLGHSPTEIQSELDERFSRVANVLERVVDDKAK